MDGPQAGLAVRPLREDERPWLAAYLADVWGGPLVVSRGRAVDAGALPALACVDAPDRVVGVATYDVRDGQCELVTIDALDRGRGVGSALLTAVAEQARLAGCRRLWLVTTNDNLRALRFYQRRGLRLAALHVGAVDAARRRKPGIALVGHDGIPLHDELELELRLG